MKTSFIIFQKSNLEISELIDWELHGHRNYVVRDPNFLDEILYLSDSEYKRLLRVALSNEINLVVLASPRDSLATVLARLSISNQTPKASELPLIMENSLDRKFRLMNLIPGWSVSDSMIKIKRNFYQFIPSIYRNINSWLGHALNLRHFKSVWLVSNFFEKIRKHPRY